MGVEEVERLVVGVVLCVVQIVAELEVDAASMEDAVAKRASEASLIPDARAGADGSRASHAEAN